MAVIDDILVNGMILWYLYHMLSFNDRYRQWMGILVGFIAVLFSYLMRQQNLYIGFISFPLFFLYIVFLHFFSKEDIRSDFLVLVIAFVIVMMIDAVCMTGIEYIVFRNNPDVPYDAVMPVVMMVSDAVLYLALRMIVQTKKKSDLSVSSVAEPGTLAMYFLIFIIFFSFSHFTYQNESHSLYTILLLSALILVTICSFTLLLRETRKNMDLEQLRLEKRKLEAHLVNTEKLIGSAKRMEAERHDMKYVLLAVKHEIHENNLEQAEKTIDEQIRSVKSIEPVTVTDNRIVDYYINDCREKAHQQGIEFVTTIDERISVTLKDEELSAVLGNLLDNALENCEGRKKISIVIQPINEYYRFEIRNSVTEREDTENPDLVSRKHSPGHGYGVKSVKHIIEENGGTIRFKIANSVFICTFLVHVA